MFVELGKISTCFIKNSRQYSNKLCRGLFSQTTICELLVKTNKICYRAVCKISNN